MEALYEPISNKKVEAILAEISKLDREDKEFFRIQLQAAYWLEEGIPILQMASEEGEIGLSEINEIKHISRNLNE
jgi:hypothetical protein